MRVLMVEDSAPLRSALTRGLRRTGFIVDEAPDGALALDLSAVYPYEVIVLDLMLPRLSGLEFLARLRETTHPARVLVLSARDLVKDRVAALNLGADDYLTKPFAFDELKARITALGRRFAGTRSPLLTVGALSIDTAARTTEVNGKLVNLSPKEYALLETLLRNRGQCFSRLALFERLYESTSQSSDRVIEVIVSGLRAKLERAGCSDLIHTRRGFGYRVP